MVSLKIQEWLAPDVKKERDSALIQVHDLKQRLNEAQELAARFAIEDQKHRIELLAVQRPETPKIFKAATAAEVRRMMERDSEKEN